MSAIAAVFAAIVVYSLVRAGFVALRSGKILVRRPRVGVRISDLRLYYGPRQ